MDLPNQKRRDAGSVIDRTQTLVLSVLVLALLGWTTDAQAQGRRDVLGWRAGIGSGFNVGGELDHRDVRDRDLEATYLLRAHAEKGLFAKRMDRAIVGLAMGPKVKTSWWEADDSPAFGDRNFLFDAMLSVRVTVDWKEFRLFHGPAMGLTISATDKDAGVDDPRPGFVLDYTVAGFEWWFSPKVALFTDLGVTYHFVEHEYENTIRNGPDDVELRLRQAMLEGGIVFAL